MLSSPNNDNDPNMNHSNDAADLASPICFGAPKLNALPANKGAASAASLDIGRAGANIDKDSAVDSDHDGADNTDPLQNKKDVAAGAIAGV